MIKKSIVFLTNLHLWSIDEGKGGKAFFHTVSAYIENNWDVTLITTGGGVPADIRNFATILEKDFSYLDKKINSRSKWKSVVYRFIKLRELTKFYQDTFCQLVKSGKVVSIIYSYEVEAVCAGKQLSTKFKIPLVTRFQGTIISKITEGIINSLKFSPHFSALKTPAQLIIMTNDGTQGLQTLKRLGNRSKVVFWRNGIDTIQLDSKKREIIRGNLGIGEGQVFITVSRLVGWKRVHLAIQGFSEVVKKFPTSRLIVIGDGPEMDRLVGLTRILGCELSVQFLGAVRQQEVADYLNAADIFLSFYDLSNLGNPIMEAMIVGKPIITIDVGDTKELIRDKENGILIPGDRLDMIAPTMLSLLVDKNLKMKISEGAIRTSKSEFWSWKSRMTAELKEIEDLILT